MKSRARYWPGTVAAALTTTVTVMPTREPAARVRS